jgi:deoxyadenosine/deoxycytidine kinase
MIIIDVDNLDFVERPEDLKVVIATIDKALAYMK